MRNSVVVTRQKKHLRFESDVENETLAKFMKSNRFNEKEASMFIAEGLNIKEVKDLFNNFIENDLTPD